MYNNKKLFSLELYKGKIINRPSKKIRSPYLADVLFNDDNILCHSPALGCCGLVSTDTTVLMTKKSSDKIKSKYSIDFVLYNNIKIGINPNYGNKFGKICLENNYFDELPKFDYLKSEYKYKNSRFDFYGEKDEKKYYIEIKCVPLADYVDVDRKDRYKYIDNQYEENSKIAIFPDGYRKKKTDTVSERALKHVKHLIDLKKEGNECALIFFIQRTDCKYFQGSNLDLQYKKILNEAYDSGVKIMPYEIIWDENNTSYLGKKLIFLSMIKNDKKINNIIINNNTNKEIYKNMKVIDLKKLCKTNKIKGYSKLKKNDLINLIIDNI